MPGMFQETAISAVAHVIELAVAPVFLLTGIGALLGVMTNRLARIVDRARTLERRSAVTAAQVGEIEGELSTLSRRAKVVSLAIGLCTTTALLVSSVIVILFLGAFVPFDISTPVASLFVAAMVVLVVALVLFLREILLATAGLRFRHQETDQS